VQAELREAERVQAELREEFQKANEEFKKVKLHRLAVGTRGAV
jgi:hypothetical protein